MAQMNVEEIYEKLIEENYFTDDELSLITSINGYTIQTLEDCIYARYGLRTYTDLFEL